MQRRHAARRRLAIGAIGALTALVVVVLVPPAPAQDAAGPAYTPGSGLATATAVNPVVAAGNLQIAVVAGQANASYRDRTAAGISALFDIPVLRSVSGTEICGTVPQGVSLSPPLVADTGPNGDQKPVRATGAADGSGAEQSAAAEPAAHATATAGLGDVDLPPLVAVTGSQMRAEVRSDAAATTRTATAHSTIGKVELLGGLVTLDGLQWDVGQSYTGHDDRDRVAKEHHSFDLEGITIGLPGLPLTRLPVASTDQLASVVSRANQLLAPLGVQLRLPTHQEDPAAGLQGVSPLTVALGGRKFVLGGPLGTLFTSKAFQQLTQAVLHSAFDPTDCNQLGGLMKGLGPEFNATYNQLGGMGPLLVAVVAGALGGTGEIQLNLGGVSTRLDDTYYAPPDLAPPLLSTPSLEPGVPALGQPVTVPGLTSPVTTPATPGRAPRLVSSTRCETTSPAGKPGCWGGRAEAAGIAAVLVTAGLLVADEVVRRRRAPVARSQEVPS